MARSTQSPRSSVWHLNLRTLLGAIVGILAVLVLIGCAVAGIEAWGRYSVSTRVAAVNLDTDLLLKGSENLQLERGLINTALQAPAAAAATVREAIAKRRANVDPNIQQALARLERGDIADKARLIADVRTALDRFTQLRQKADAAIGLAKDQRDPDLAKAWYPAASDLLIKVQALWTAASREVSREDAIVGQLTIIKQSAFLMREYAGRERAVYAGSISAGQPISAERQRDIANFRGHVDMAWQTVRDLGAGTAEPLPTAIAEAQRQYFTRYKEQAEAVYKAGTSDGKYAMTAAQWLEVSNPALDSLLNIKDAAVEVTVAHAAANATSAQLRLVLVGVLTSLGLVISAFSIAMVSRRVVRPITAMTATMTALAGGNRAVDIPGAARHDEIGDMARAVVTFRQNMNHTAELEETRAREEKDRSRRRETVDALVQNFTREIDRIVHTVATAATQMRTSSQAMSATAEETSRQSSAVAAASEEASTNVQTVASASEELSASIVEISRRVAQSAQIASQAVAEAKRTDQSVTGLAQAAQKIGDVVKMINDIAGQTNLLALNATIEAARAGEAGKGFAVVASEVKSLATQTARATEDISAQISGIQSATQNAVGAIQGIGKTIGEINEIASTIAAAVEEQGAATQEISRNVQQASKGTSEVSENIAGVTQAAGQTGRTASEVLSAAVELSQQSETLRGEVDKFLAEIRAA
jgi:methyl-accepting chemotaxis protein